MKRLREIEAPSPLVEKAQALIESVDREPVSHESMLRIRRELDQPRYKRRRRFAAAPLRSALATAMRIPALALSMMIVLFGASAFAAVRIYVAVTQAPADKPALVAPEPAQRAARKHRVARPKPPLAQPAEAEAQDKTEDTTEATQPVVRPPARTEPRVHAKIQPKPALRSADSELVHRAVQALRVDHDPALAARLLDENRARNPHGPLAEEALSLQIEAAIDLGAPRARTLAAEYVARYPNGRYLEVARRALGDHAP